MKRSSLGATARYACRVVTSVWLVACLGACRLVSSSPSDSGEPFRRALEHAAAANAADELASLVNVTRRVVFREPKHVHISRLLPIDGKLIAVNVLNQRVDAYDDEGKWISRIGRSGTSAGSFIMPTGLAQTGANEFAVLDFRPARISIFATDGTFVRAQLYTRQHFSGVQLAYQPSRKGFVIFGNRSNQLVHLVAEGGDLLGNWYDMPTEQAAPWAHTYYEPSVANAPGAVYFAVPFTNDLMRLTSAGALTSVGKALLGGYRFPTHTLEQPASPEDETSDEHYNRFQSWRLHWTPIDGLAVVGNKLLVTIQTFDPLRYRLEVWNVDTGEMSTALKTNHQLLCADTEGRLYFRESADQRKDGRDGIIVASLKQ